MKIISKTGYPKFATVYVAKMRNDPKALIEFVDACDPRYPKKEKWVIIVSTQIGCPVKCVMCDSGTFFLGNLTKDEIFAQIDFIFSTSSKNKINRYDHPKLKIQFARMGEPSLNPAVLEVLRELGPRYRVQGLMPCIATVAPYSAQKWLEELKELKDELYSNGKFQMQFSINSTHEDERDKIMPIKKLSLQEISKYGEKFYKDGDRKVTLNFALAINSVISPEKIAETFDPKKFIIKITPVNPTDKAEMNYIKTVISPETPENADHIAKQLKLFGFETIISIGAKEEIAIGSNCGQSVRKILNGLKFPLTAPNHRQLSRNQLDGCA